ncbi:hypothetical protein SERPOUNCE_39 [Bacillus phage SerPounce]|uniref:Uncharacterized protein n=1 Tax=Bacillus phage SerPounce TaxID=1983413 RepID=A0A1X9SHG5_9CAUD|nr:hypothetical protein H3011_gp39 [Bacillus phage SerPounce]ARQ95573.1 hypothetical protein SERPOUNCE_39 [Bacillus phage SerPounce]
MITIEYNSYGSLYIKSKSFKGDNCFDDFLYWFFKNDIRDYKFTKGKEYILGEIKQKGINNK